MPVTVSFQIRAFLIRSVLIVFCGVSSVGAQSPASESDLTTEQLFDYVNRSVCTVVTLD